MDIERLEARRADIVSQEDEILYNEVVESCRHNLLRSAYIVSWILTVESLKRKIYALADLGEKRALTLKSNIKTLVSQRLSTDRTIFEGIIKADIVHAKFTSDLSSGGLQKNFTDLLCASIETRGYDNLSKEKKICFMKKQMSIWGDFTYDIWKDINDNLFE